MVTRDGDPPGRRGADGIPAGRAAEVAHQELLADGLAPSLRERFAGTAVSRLVAPDRPAVIRMITVCAVAAVVVSAAVHALRPPGVSAPAAPRLLGVSVAVPPPGPGRAIGAPVVATYRFTSPSPGTRFGVTGVTGPLVLRSTSHRVAPPDGSHDAVFRVSATPACHGREPSQPHYVVTMTRTASDGESTSRQLRSRATVDWGMALRQVCWQELSARSVRIAGLRAEPGGRSRQIVLTVTLHNALSDDIGIQVIDVADVSTLSASDAGQLRAGADRDFRVRWPVADCGVPTLPEHTFVSTSRAAGQVLPALEWSVGPGDTDPAALFVTPLSTGQLATIHAAINRLCTPPDTTVEVTSARALPPDPVVVDHTGVAISVRLSLRSAAHRIVVGDSPTRLTADARVAITEARVRPVRHHPASATVVWRARCSPPDPGPPMLPVRIDSHGRSVSYAVRLNDRVLARAYSRACGLDPDRLLLAGWAAVGTSPSKPAATATRR